MRTGWASGEDNNDGVGRAESYDNGGGDGRVVGVVMLDMPSVEQRLEGVERVVRRIVHKNRGLFVV